MNIVGFDVVGDGNIVDLVGGININYIEDVDGFELVVIGINISGDSSVILSGEFMFNIVIVFGGVVMLVNVRNGGNLMLD